MGDEIVGGVTAHTLPMTRTESAELFIYDLAVPADQQRQGIGRGLIATLRDAATTAGIQVVFVPADDDDVHALDFYRALGEAVAGDDLTFFGDEASNEETHEQTNGSRLGARRGPLS